LRIDLLNAPAKNYTVSQKVTLFIFVIT